jgi:hypothetical protein
MLTEVNLLTYKYFAGDGCEDFVQDEYGRYQSFCLQKKLHIKTNI